MGYQDFYSAYIDNILIFSKTEAEHKIHVKRILARLRKARLQADIKKYEFYITKTKFLGFIINTEGISINSKKVIAVRDWKIPQNLKEV